MGKDLNKDSLLTLYHGTCSKKLDKIINKGLSKPYLTNSCELAMYYAGEAVEEYGGDEIILEVNVMPSNLEIDYKALDEPVSFGKYTIDQLEDIVEDMWFDTGKKHPEWVKNGYVKLPKDNYKLSLYTVASCKCNINIVSNEIKVKEMEY